MAIDVSTDEEDRVAARVARDAETRRRLGTVFGWIAGGSTGLLVNLALFRAFGEGYPTTYTTFALFLIGAFAGMTVSDRLGARAFRPLGIAAGLLLAVMIALVLAYVATTD